MGLATKTKFFVHCTSGGSAKEAALERPCLRLPAFPADPLGPNRDFVGALTFVTFRSIYAE
jgi:hypothetical protein